MNERYFAGIEISENSNNRQSDEDKLVGLACKIDIENEYFHFEVIKRKEKSYLCIEIDKLTEVPNTLMRIAVNNSTR